MMSLSVGDCKTAEAATRIVTSFASFDANGTRTERERVFYLTGLIGATQPSANTYRNGSSTTPAPVRTGA